MIKARFMMRDGITFEATMKDEAGYHTLTQRMAQRLREGRPLLAMPGQNATYINLNHLIGAQIIEGDADE